MFNRRERKNVMNLNAWKQFGVICSGIWLLLSGLVTAWKAIEALFTEDYVFYALLVKILPVYILFGLGPVIGFAVLMNRLGHPLGRVGLMCLEICAAIPFLWFLLLG